jgi:hypothetical protein
MIKRKAFPSPPRSDWTMLKKPTFFQEWVARPTLALSYFGINTVVLAFACIPPYVGADGTNRVVKGWIFAASGGGILLFSIFYYFVVIPDRSGHKMTRWKSGWSIIKWTGAEARIEPREGGFDESYGFKQTLRVTFQEDSPEAKVSRSLQYLHPKTKQ